MTTRISKDRRFWLHLFLQTSAAVAFMWLMLMGLDEISTSTIIWAAGASTLASSSYLIFCVPQATVAHPLKIIGSYVIAMAVGEAMRLFANYICEILPHCQIGHPSMHIFEVAAAISVGISLLLMVLCKSEHPPAAGLAVVMVLDIRNLYALGIILFGAALLALIRVIFRNKLHNLC